MPAARYSRARAGYRSAQDLVYTPSFSQASALRGADGRTVGGSTDDHTLLFVTLDFGAERGHFSSSWSCWWWRSSRFTPRTVFYSVLWSRSSFSDCPSKSLTFQLRVVAEFFILHRRLPVCRVRQINGVFALFQREKSATMGPHSGSELGADTSSSTLGGSAGGFLRGRSRCVDAISRWLVETSGLGPRSLAAWVKAGTGPSSCVSLRLLVEEFRRVFLVHCARAVRTWNLVHYFLCRCFWQLCSGRLGIAEEY